MKTTKKIEDGFIVKFGLLKKGIVLFNKERYSDSFTNIAKAAEMVRQEKKEEDERLEENDKMWRFRCEIPPDLKINKDVFLEKPITEKAVEKLGVAITVQSLQLYLNKTASDATQQPSKNRFLNDQIELFYFQVRHQLSGQKNAIDRMKEKVSTLRTDEKKKTELCPSVKEKRIIILHSIFYYFRKMPTWK